MTQNTRNWLHGLVAAFIGGGASAITAGIGASVIKPESFNFHSQVGVTLELMGALFLVNGILSAMFYLKQSPLPPEASNAQNP